jgi:hypothetical protein
MPGRASAVQSKEVEISFDALPSSAVQRTTLAICLKCAFDFFTKQLKLTPRTAYSELKKHTPEESDFTGSSTARPHFFESSATDHCPYCNATKRWFGRFHAVRIDANDSIEKSRKKIWTALKKSPEQYRLWTAQRTPMQLFSEWLERLQRGLDLDVDEWLTISALEYLKRFEPRWPGREIGFANVRQVQVSRQIKGPWQLEDDTVYVAPLLYGDILLVQYLISRSHSHGGRTLEGRVTLNELISQLRRLSYFEARGIEAGEPYQALEAAVESLVSSGPVAVYYAVDRGSYLDQLRSVYEKKRDK